MRKKTIDTIPVLSDAMKEVLSSFSKSRSLSASLVKRAKIIILASQGESNQTIAAKDGLQKCQTVGMIISNNPTVLENLKCKPNRK